METYKTKLLRHYNAREITLRAQILRLERHYKPYFLAKLHYRKTIASLIGELEYVLRFKKILENEN